ncbi:leucine-rich repeat-containing protein 23-like [Amphibalanus amphitrite]|nr:leucine-rich repeat-containing protein 23-like [Amphibalanus amphitrite]
MTTENLPNLIHLNITNNALKKLDGLEHRTLKTLYAAGNKLRNLSGVSRLTSLSRLHLRDNRISSLKGLEEDHETLEYLNVRSNNLEEVEEAYHLSRMKKLTTLVIADNAVSDSDSYRVDALVYGRRLQRIDKDPVEEERQEAAELYPQREEERLLAEREAKERPADEEPDQDDLDSQRDDDEDRDEEDD